MKLESLKNEKFSALSLEAMKTLRGGGQGFTTPAGELLQNGKRVKYEQDYMCHEGAENGNDWCGEYLIDGKWTGAECKY